MRSLPRNRESQERWGRLPRRKVRVIRGSLRNEVVEDRCRRCPKYDPGSTIHVTSATTICSSTNHATTNSTICTASKCSSAKNNPSTARRRDGSDDTGRGNGFRRRFFVTLWLRTSNTKVKVGKFEIEVENSVRNNVLQQCAKFGEERENIAVRNLLRVDAVAAAMT